MKIIYSPQFRREYKKLTEILKDKAEEKEAIFCDNPVNPILKTIKL